MSQDQIAAQANFGFANISQSNVSKEPSLLEKVIVSFAALSALTGVILFGAGVVL